MKKTLLIFSLFFAFLMQAQSPQATMRYFEFHTTCGHGRWQDTTFIAAASDPKIIKSVLISLSKPINKRFKFISGAIAYGNGGYNHNANHRFSWHFIPNQWQLVDMSIELCDGCPYSDLDAHTQYWVETVGQYCPWSGIPSREVFNPALSNARITSEFSQSAENNLNNFSEIISVYPNPASNTLLFNLGGLTEASVIIYNNIGEKVMEISTFSDEGSIDIKTLSSGIYFVEISHEKNHTIKKIVVLNNN